MATSIDKQGFFIPSNFSIFKEIIKLKNEFFKSDFEMTREKTLYVEQFGHPVILFYNKNKRKQEKMYVFWSEGQKQIMENNKIKQTLYIDIMFWATPMGYCATTVIMIHDKQSDKFFPVHFAFLQNWTKETYVTLLKSF